MGDKDQGGPATGSDALPKRSVAGHGQGPRCICKVSEGVRTLNRRCPVHGEEAEADRLRRAALEAEQRRAGAASVPAPATPGPLGADVETLSPGDQRRMQTRYHGRYSGLQSRHGPGRPDLQLFAFCRCGWRGPAHWCDGEVFEDAVRSELEAERAAHERATGHPEDLEVGANGRHDFGCRFYHDLLDHCPKPASSPSGRLYRVLRAATTDVSQALGALRAIDELRRWLDEREPEAVMSARLAGATWEQIGETVGTTRQGAWNRWGRLTAAYEDAGLLPRSEDGDVGA